MNCILGNVKLITNIEHKNNFPINPNPNTFTFLLPGNCNENIRNNNSYHSLNSLFSFLTKYEFISCKLQNINAMSHYSLTIFMKYSRIYS